MGKVDNISKFWWLKQYIEAKGYNVGHSLFSIGHFLWLFFIVVGIVFFIKFYNSVNNKEKQECKRFLALAIFILEYVKTIIVGFIYPEYINMYLPLHLCSFAGMCIIFEACFGSRKIIDQMWLYVFLPASLLGILSPSVSVPFLNFFTFHTYLYHGILLLFSMIKICSDKVQASYSGLLKSSLVVLIIGIPVYFLNGLFGTNYFIISDASDFPAAQIFWNAVVPKFGEFGYALGMYIFAFFIFNLIYLIIITVEHLKKKK